MKEIEGLNILKLIMINYNNFWLVTKFYLFQNDEISNRRIFHQLRDMIATVGIELVSRRQLNKFLSIILSY